MKQDRFFKIYQEEEEQATMLKLKDWPPRPTSASAFRATIRCSFTHAFHPACLARILWCLQSQANISLRGRLLRPKQVQPTAVSRPPRTAHAFTLTPKCYNQELRLNIASKLLSLGWQTLRLLVLPDYCAVIMLLACSAASAARNTPQAQHGEMTGLPSALTACQLCCIHFESCICAGDVT